jgi:glycerol-3-phosphate acyltransferase PlsX
VARAAATVAVDGHGAEQGPHILAEGVRKAAADGIRIRVFGPAGELALDGVDGVEVIDCDEWISNEEEPVRAVRSRPEASIVRAVADVAAGNADAVSSHGSTGATMAAATFGLRRLKGIQRPALAAQVPVPGKPVLFLDVGANTEVRAQHLVQFAYLGAAFSRAVLGVEDPGVGLLSVGEEPGKGTETVVEANRQLREAEEIRFLGNVEGGDLTSAKADVVVTGGFVGNIAIKIMEGTVRAVSGAIKDRARSNPVAAVGGLLLKPALNGLREELHPDTTGGAILLGLRHIAVVGHGSAGADGIANSIRLAARSVEVDAVNRTARMLAEGGISRRPVAVE